MQGGPLGSEFNAFIIRFVISAFNEKNHAALQEIGLTPKQLQRLRNMTLDDLGRLSSFRTTVANISFDARRLDLMIDHVESEGARDSIVDQMIQMGASQAMLEDLAGIDHSEYRNRRRVLGLPKASAGRPAAISEDQALQVYQSWRKHADELDDLKRYYFLGLETGIPLSQIWTHMVANEAPEETAA
ncbi:MAG: STY4526/YPO1902 family pathogenicity island replication protein [Gammaproteobacteria bacterium]|jgi:hypothetical protein